jgi:hypothetical protein
MQRRVAAAAAALAVAAAPPAAAQGAVRVATADVLAGPVIAGPDVAWGEGRDVRGDTTRTLLVRAQPPGRGRVRTVYRSTLPVRSRYDSQLFEEMDASQDALAVVTNLNEACCGPVFRVRGARLGKPFGRLSATEGPAFLDVDGPRVAFAENAAYSNDPISDGTDGLPPESPCDGPGLPACSTVNVRDLRSKDAVAVLAAPRGESLTDVRLAGRFVAWIRRGPGTDPVVTVWDLNAAQEAFSLTTAQLGGEPRAIDVDDAGTLVVALASTRIVAATPAAPAPRELHGASDGVRLRLGRGLVAFRTPRGALKLGSVAARTARTITKGPVAPKAWDHGAERLTWAQRVPGSTREAIFLEQL